jgi:hydrogenase nickel incorporation protein HypB
MCHLDAHMVGHALTDLAPADDIVLFIENIGNLVCPAAFDLGEQAKVVLLSVPEGDDKPLKYPDMFAAATLVVLTKADLLPYVPFDVGRARAAARTINPGLEILEVSALTGAGLDRWYEWICRRRHRTKRSLVPAGAAQAGS